MSAKKKILYIQTSSVDTSERTYAPFVLAATASAMGLAATLNDLALDADTLLCF